MILCDKNNLANKIFRFQRAAFSFEQALSCAWSFADYLKNCHDNRMI